MATVFTHVSLSIMLYVRCVSFPFIVTTIGGTCQLFH